MQGILKMLGVTPGLNEVATAAAPMVTTTSGTVPTTTSGTVPTLTDKTMEALDSYGRIDVIASAVSCPFLAYHGYKRNDSLGWALMWGIPGSWAWPIMVPVALAQGFGKRAK